MCLENRQSDSPAGGQCSPGNLTQMAGTRAPPPVVKKEVGCGRGGRGQAGRRRSQEGVSGFQGGQRGRRHTELACPRSQRETPGLGNRAPAGLAQLGEGAPGSRSLCDKAEMLLRHCSVGSRARPSLLPPTR